MLCVGGIGHLAKLVLLGELAGQSTKILDESLGRIDDCLARSNLTIGLNPQLEFRGEGVRDLELTG